MQDAFAYCTELVRTADRDRYLATLFAPSERRGALCALYAFDGELARVRELAREPLPGEIRLQWWNDVLRGERDGEAAANPVASALVQTIARHGVNTAALLRVIEARRADLYDEPMRTTAELEEYVRTTSSVLFALATKILSGADVHEAADPAGIAYGIALLLRAFPLHAARGQLYVPADLLAQHGVQTSDVFGGRSSDGLNAALADMRDLARRHLALAHAQLPELPQQVLSAFLPVALVGPTLRRLDRCGAFSLVEISPWRRQWLIWRAARNPARIAN